MTPTHPHAIVCISSHVARGTVGNRAAAFASETLGHPVWSVPTVLLPWHPGQGPGTRMVWPSDGFTALLRDLEHSPHLGEIGGVLSGYLGEPSQAEAIAALVDRVKAANPQALYCCDPVMGNERGLYVPEDTARAIAAHLVPRADIVTPNRHELQWLSGSVLSDNTVLVRAARSLGPPRVLVTSAHAPPGRTGNLLVTQDRADLAEHIRIDAPNSGTGDLTAALFLSRLVSGQDDRTALRATSAAVLDAIRAEAAKGTDELPLEAMRDRLVDPVSIVDVASLPDEALAPEGVGS